MSADRPPDPGRMGARLALQGLQAVPDGQGGVTGSWQTRAWLWAKVEPQRIVIATEGPDEVAQCDHAVTVYFRRDLARGQRFVWGERVLAIRAWRDPDESRRVLIVDCREDLP